MFQIERQQAIVKYLNDHRTANVEELCEYFNVSKATIRRDINELARNNLIIKAHGGALMADDIQYQEIPYSQKRDVNSESKQKIGAAAAELIQDGDIIIVDSGSTTFEMIRHITKQIVLLTHDLMIALATAENSNIRTLVAGGEIRHDQYAFSGYDTVAFYRNHHAHKAFLGCDAINLETGLWTRTTDEAAIKQEIIQAAGQIILMTDQDKFSASAFCRFCGISAVDCIISDKFSSEQRSDVRLQDIQLIDAFS